MLYPSGSPLFFLLLGNLLRLVRVTQKKAFDRNNEVIIIIITIIILQNIFVYCMLWFFHIRCATITVITINLFLENFFNSLIPEGF